MHSNLDPIYTAGTLGIKHNPEKFKSKQKKNWYWNSILDIFRLIWSNSIILEKKLEETYLTKFI